MGLLEETLARIAPSDAKSRASARARLEQLTMPHWALGRLMDLAEDLAGMTASMKPPVERRLVFTMAADHGVTAEGVSQYPQEVTGQMVRNFTAGGAGVNALARVADAKVIVVDMGVSADVSDLTAKGAIVSRSVGLGTANMARGAAMTREQAVRSLQSGIEIAVESAADADIFGTGEMGIGNTTAGSAIVAVMTGGDVREVTDKGTGIDAERLAHKIAVIERAIEVNAPDPADAIDTLSKVGGFEIGGIAGLILGAASLRKPVLVDGFISTAGALIAHALAPASADYMIAAHRSAERGHARALERLGKEPFLDLGMRLGEGTGAALAMKLVEAAVRILTEVATFEEAAVSQASEE